MLLWINNFAVSMGIKWGLQCSFKIRDNSNTLKLTSHCQPFVNCQSFTCTWVYHLSVYFTLIFMDNMISWVENWLLIHREYHPNGESVVGCILVLYCCEDQMFLCADVTHIIQVFLSHCLYYFIRFAMGYHIKNYIYL